MAHDYIPLHNRSKRDMSYSSSFVHKFLNQLQRHQQQNPTATRWDLPRYDATDEADQQVIISRSTPHAFQLGTGASIFTSTLIPAIVSARSEVVFVTCFWAPSKALSAITDALVKLANHRRHLPNQQDIEPLTVRICFSSRSIFQKLLHPQSHDGYTYSPAEWQNKLGLPDPALLGEAGIRLQVKSLFFLPFSVMHPKFVIIDRQRAFIPSCNVSWEPWLEGCVEITGDAVTSLMSFYALTWEKHLDFRKPLPASHSSRTSELQHQFLDPQDLIFVPSSAHHLVRPAASSEPLPTLVLPSSHHQNPQFRFLPWQRAAKPPATPLNVAMLELFEQARRSIYLQTPNLTCEPVIAALLDALKRGVDVTIVTGRNMMLLEQLVTAGTTTSWCLRSLVRRFKKLRTHAAARDLESGDPGLGHLRISYFQPRSATKAGKRGSQARAVNDAQMQDPEEEEPVHSHLKLTIVDREFTVLGSGNMDRASWYTSQELGVLFHDPAFAGSVREGVDLVLDQRLALVFDSGNN
ncbi:hypothetical protein SMACR_05051 [Sordaria macrospora]|uniref:WGS project CABT00000000 data, contig 2.22 n=2 Tax=Sordaria macrospora TaxID=5147 RepID=F7W2I6_SORMK|nr:uncharacterized protein SMAC_05051 [Sordaria macrospora k-hell]KAA8633476.1 hypothetical protein SMACR_05051 [Sordaria macrospora]KAH7632578.1 hypothetical protein B0T09DRAFT_76433 [Sordaria sp. MPI-SDFR-AT-0083]WPJ60936.1 hypothetical protein SMAC4_05051 [Sordaria macrospora]CCC11837.1 unnamed protein product [Sordaria macrospora k-hell]